MNDDLIRTREALPLTRRKLVSGASVTDFTIYRVEHGTTFLEPSIIQKLTTDLGVQATEIAVFDGWFYN